MRVSKRACRKRSSSGGCCFTLSSASSSSRSSRPLTPLSSRSGLRTCPPTPHPKKLRPPTESSPRQQPMIRAADNPRGAQARSRETDVEMHTFIALGRAEAGLRATAVPRARSTRRRRSSRCRSGSGQSWLLSMTSASPIRPHAFTLLPAFARSTASRFCTCVGIWMSLRHLTHAAHVLYFELEIDRFKYRRFTQVNSQPSAIPAYRRLLPTAPVAALVLSRSTCMDGGQPTPYSHSFTANP